MMRTKKTYQKNSTKMWPFNKKKINTQRPILNGIDVTDPTIDPVEKEWPCVELTIDLDYKDFCIRLWIDRTQECKDQDSVENIIGFITSELAYLEQTKERELGRPATREEVHNFLAHALLDLNAIQVLDKNSHDGVKIGKVIYCVSFNDDVHG